MNILSALKQTMTVRFFAAITIASLILSAFPVAFFVAQAANNSAVGTITATVMPAPTEGGSEYFVISFAGTGTLDLTGWTVSDTLASENLRYTFGATTLTNGQSFKICGDDEASAGCNAENSGGNAVWNNPGDTLILKSEVATTILSVTFSGAISDTEYSNTTEVNYLPAATCSDAIQNQDETGVDTGGPCPAEVILGCTDPAADDYEPLATSGNPEAEMCDYPTEVCEEIDSEDCLEDEADQGQVTVKKIVMGAEVSPSDFAFYYEGAGESISFEEDGENTITLDEGTYTFEEKTPKGWNVTYDDCEDVVVTADAEITPICTITNTLIVEVAEPQAQCEAGENLLTNASFENPTLPEDGDGWDVFDSVVDGLAWVVDWVSPTEDSPEVGKLELQNGRTASEGSQYAELDSNFNNAPGGPYDGEDTRVRISQVISTIPGEEYEFSFDFSALPGTGFRNNVVSFLVDGNLVDTNSAGGRLNSDTEWTNHSYTFTATDNTTEVALADAGIPDTFGTLVDNVSLTCIPGPEVSSYCGDATVNQEWEQCDGGEGCTEQCLFANQCSTIELVKVNLDETENSTSFDGNIYLGNTNTLIPSGVWFPFSVIGDETAQSIANDRDGLAVQRDTETGELKLAVVGQNGRRGVDYVSGTIDLFNATFGEKTRSLVPEYVLEDLDEDRPNQLEDVFTEVADTQMSFDWRVYGSNDAARVQVVSDDIDCDSENNQDTEVYRISGNVWSDENEDGTRTEENEDSVEGWKVFITNGELTLETTSDASGNYYFDVPAGTWTITQEVRDNWSPTFPSPNQHIVTVPLSEEPETFFESIFNMIIPEAEAATIILATYSGYNFGNVYNNGGSGGGNKNKLKRSPSGEVLGASDTASSTVDQVGIMPVGAPNAGQGGSVSDSYTLALVMFFSALLLMVLTTPRVKHAE